MANGKPKVLIKLTPALVKALRKKSVPVIDPAVVNVWHEAAVALASWASERLLNITKGYGG